MSTNDVGVLQAVVLMIRSPDGAFVIDRGGDVWLPTAFRNGQPTALAAAEHGDHYNHTPPVGRGHLVVKHEQVEFHGRYFLDTQLGASEFAVAKAMGDLYEWSPRFLAKYEAPSSSLRARGARRLIVEADVISVSPTLRGEGRGTRTLLIKRVPASAWLTLKTDEALACHLQNEIAVGVAEHTQMGKRLRALRLVA
jgi:hypothetical protein